MPKKKYTAKFKTKAILTIIQRDKEFNAICADFNLNPRMVRKWKQEFVSVKFSSVIHLTVDNYYLRGFGFISISV